MRKIEPDMIRDVVRLASRDVENAFVADWLFKDERGTWERRAHELLTWVTERYPDTPWAQIREETARKVAVEALSAALEHAKKGA